ncbi:hypothetical protein PC9H_000109 [Pleurotus ostreatus]|uniref:Uncharacterized protein n=1 Tax=Pleurotus ostreatus TaxID=5322 RepID=A0A8H7A198_PLEOS|nr:uncharacterized protein PC9H_000109 [Pleurotus ostreatus]KAF7439773.1 hypothetical protein PC9H_000109 [Pleurotus ostreatus]
MPLTKFVASILHKLNHWRSQARLALHAANADIILDENLPNPPSFEEHKHKDMEYIWDTTLRSCWPTNDAAKLQLVKKPQRATGQAPVEGTGGCGSKKRKSIDESDLESNDEDPKPKKVKSITSEALSHGPKERKSSKKMPSVATRRSTRLHMGSTN